MQTVFILSTFLISLLRAAKNHLLIPGPPAFFVLYTYLQLSGGLSASRRLTYNIGSCAIRGVSNLREIQLEMVSTILNLAVRKRNLRPSITIKNPRTAHSRERYTPFFVRPALLTILILIGFTTSGQECGDVQKVRLSMNISSEILDSLYVKALNNLSSSFCSAFFRPAYLLGHRAAFADWSLPFHIQTLFCRPHAFSIFVAVVRNVYLFASGIRSLKQFEQRRLFLHFFWMQTLFILWRFKSLSPGRQKAPFATRAASVLFSLQVFSTFR